MSKRLSSLVVGFVFLVMTNMGRAATHFFVAPSGKQSSPCTRKLPCTLVGARQRVRLEIPHQKTDIVVELLDGIYRLREPFVLEESARASDSGGNGHSVIWRAAPGAKPILSGGLEVNGWKLHDSSLNIWRAPIVAAEQYRQLYINGKRAERSRSPNWIQGLEVTETGFRPRYGQDISRFRNLTDIELVRVFQFQVSRCALVSASPLELRVAPMCFTNSKLVDAELYVENAYELLRSPGQWYLDRSGAVAGEPSIFYIPREGEDLRNSPSELAVTERLMVLQGEPGRPIHDVTIRGLTFQYGTWLISHGPTGKVGGYAGLQAGIHLLTPFDFVTEIVPENPGYGFYNPENFGYVDNLPANVAVHHAQRITFEANRFEHMGATALGLLRAVQDSRVVGNQFDDVSAAAIQLGGVSIEDHHPCGDVPDCKSEMITRHNAISHNRILNTAVEFFDTVAIFVGHVQDTLIDHNSIEHTSYTGISVGYGWGYIDAGGYLGFKHPTIDARNRIEANEVSDFMTRLDDGGAIYTLSAQPGSTIVGNHAHDAGTHAWPGGLYLDEGTMGYTVSLNVVGRGVKAFIQVNCGAKDTNYGNVIDANFSATTQTSNLCVPGRSTMGEPQPFNVWGALETFDPENPPVAVSEIIRNAGAGSKP